MPTYEYACKACEHRFEIVQSFSEDALTTCPECDRDELRKVYNAAGIIFKGDGWHIKDYATKSGSTASGPASTSGDTSSSSGDDTSSGDAKPKAKTTAKDKDSSSGSTSKPAAG